MSIDIAAIQKIVDGANGTELEKMKADNEKILNDMRDGTSSVSSEEKTETGLRAAHTLVLVEAKLQNKGWFFKLKRRMELTSMVFTALNRKNS